MVFVPLGAEKAGLIPLDVLSIKRSTAGDFVIPRRVLSRKTSVVSLGMRLVPWKLWSSLQNFPGEIWETPGVIRLAFVCIN